MSIDISTLFEVCSFQINNEIKKSKDSSSLPLSREKAFSLVYPLILKDFINLLVLDYHQEFKKNIKLFVDHTIKEFNDISESIITECSDAYLFDEHKLRDDINNLFYLQQDKHNIIKFTNDVRFDLAKNEINQFMSFYTTVNSNELKICTKINDWISIIGLLEMIKLKVFNNHTS